MMTVIVPAHNEAPYLSWTIHNLFETCTIEPEVIVVDQGGNGEIDPRAKVLRPGRNVGEREAMNIAAAAATNEYLFRIDAHCDFSPKGWDIKMCEATGEKDVTIAVLTAVEIPWEYAQAEAKQKWLDSGKTEQEWPGWQRKKGHWYGFCRIIINEAGGLECKWQKANRDHNNYNPIEPNMGATGCGMMIRKSFYEQIGGCDTDLPKMGAIGEEMAIKAWYYGGKVQTRTDVMVGHIFGTGGYATDGVQQAQVLLNERYGSCYESVCEKFPTFETIKLRRADQPGKPIRTVTVTRVDTTTSNDENGNPLRIKTETFKYVWLANEHPDEQDWTDKEIEEKYAKEAVKVDEEINYPQAVGV